MQRCKGKVILCASASLRLCVERLRLQLRKGVESYGAARRGPGRASAETYDYYAISCYRDLPS